MRGDDGDEFQIQGCRDSSGLPPTRNSVTALLTNLRRCDDTRRVTLYNTHIYLHFGVFHSFCSFLELRIKGRKVLAGDKVSSNKTG